MRAAVAKSCLWQTGSVDDAKKRVREELAAVSPDAKDPRRLAFVLGRIHALEAAQHPAQLLERFVLIMTALVHHQKNDGLTPSQIRDLADLAYAILAVAGVKPRTSRLAFLHGELAVVLAQISRQRGQHWVSAWQQGMALHLAGENPSGGEGYMALALADRALRLGNARLALQQYALAEENAPPPARFEKARLGRLKALRLSGQLADARRLAHDTAAHAKISADARLELDWELLCADAMEKRSSVEMMTATRRGRGHFSATYLVEAWLWTRALGREPVEGFPTMRYIGRKKSGLAPRALGESYRAALVIEDCLDAELPLPARLSALGDALDVAPQALTVDKELLIHAAAARWLDAIRASAQASLAWGRYQTLALTLTEGRSADVLGLRA